MSEINGSLPDRIEDAITGVKELIDAALKPLPTETGDGSYVEDAVPTSFFRDLHDMGFEGVETMIKTLKTDASGKFADDRTYLMEKVIQVIGLNQRHEHWGRVTDLATVTAGQ